MHVQFDPPPHILEDVIGLQLVAPDESWRQRPDMEPNGTKRVRASIVARARFVEDLVEEHNRRGVSQYVIIGAGLDTFAQRKPEIASKLQIFEIDQPHTQAWKKKRLIELGYNIHQWLHFVPVDFEAGPAWFDHLFAAGFDARLPAVVASTGVSMYLTRDAIMALFRQITTCAPYSIFAMTFLQPIEYLAPEDRPMQQAAIKGSQAAGTPMISFFTGDEMLAMAHEAGFQDARIVLSEDIATRYFSGRSDGLCPPAHAEEFLVAAT